MQCKAMNKKNKGLNLLDNTTGDETNKELNERIETIKVRKHNRQATQSKVKTFRLRERKASRYKGIRE